MTEPSDNPSAGRDPFFALPEDAEWNACIGSQGDELNYVDGYLEAATALATLIVERRLYDKRDTLVMPILYNARHAIELTQKFTLRHLHSWGIVKKTPSKNHDILEHWKLLDACAIGDEDLRSYIAALKPFVVSLARIDDDGQELRYPERRDGAKSLADKALVNIDVIRAGLAELTDILAPLKARVVQFQDERQTGSYTPRCSRKDLIAIARMLPRKADWTSPAFDDAKLALRQRFGLSNRAFSDAVDVIKRSREMRGIIGLETDLTHLTDADVLFAISQWSMRHPPRQNANAIGTDYFAIRDWDKFQEEARIASAVNAAIIEKLSLEKIADLHTIYYLGRNRDFCEHYDKALERTIIELRRADLPQAVNHIMEKTNFKLAVARAAHTLGRVRLAGDIPLHAVGPL